MKSVYILGVMSGLLVATSANFCYKNVEEICSSTPTTSEGPMIAGCNAKYGMFEGLQADLQAYANAHIQTSFEYMLMSTHFGNYEVNRAGLKALYRKLSDDAWNNAIDIIKYIAKRGGTMNFKQYPRFKKNMSEKILQLNELNSLAKALDFEKELADEALTLHNQAQHHTQRDSSVAHYLEEKFFESQAERIRNLAGYTNDLKNLMTDQDASLSIFLFDEYIKNSL